MSIILKLKKLPNILRTEGLRGIFSRLKIVVYGNDYINITNNEYKRTFTSIWPTDQELIGQGQTSKTFQHAPLISIITPVYNPPIKDLIECIDSVLAQSYEHFEFILVDDNSTDLRVFQTLERYARKDARIKAKKLLKNSHISAASNEALTLASGEWIGLLDHDDVLWPNALFEIVNRINEKPKSRFIYTDEDKIDEDGLTHRDPFRKPDWSPHFMWSCNYITHFACIKKNLIESIGGFSVGLEGAQDWDLFVRATEKLNGYHQHPWDPNCAIQHVRKILYSWRMSPTSTSSEKHAVNAKSYAYLAQEKTLQAMSDRRGGGLLRQSRYLGIWELLPKIKNNPLVSIIIPTKDNVEFLKPCLDSIFAETTYKHYEVIIVDTGSIKAETFSYYELLGLKIRVVNYRAKIFNYSAAVNLGVKNVKGEYLLLLNDDTFVRTASWIEDMLSYAQLPEVGAVGCRLLYHNGKIQHTGLIFGHEKGNVLGEQGFVSNYFRTFDPLLNYGISSVYIDTVRDCSAVTAACLMIHVKKHSSIGGFDESFAIAFNDVDYCLKLLDKKLFNIMLPFVELTHYESISVGRPENGQRDLELFAREIHKFKAKWPSRYNLDSFYFDYQKTSSI